MILEIYKSWVIVLVLYELVYIFFVLFFKGKIGKVVIGNFFFFNVRKVVILFIVINCFVFYEEDLNWGLGK